MDELAEGEKRTANGFETHIFDTCASGRKIECELDKMLQAHATKACAVESISAREDEGEREREREQTKSAEDTGPCQGRASPRPTP